MTQYEVDELEEQLETWLEAAPGRGFEISYIGSGFWVSALTEVDDGGNSRAIRHKSLGIYDALLYLMYVAGQA